MEAVSIHEFLAASEQHGDAPLKLDINVFTLMCVVANIQLALRHPGNTGPSTEAAQAFVLETQKELGSVHPIFARMIDQGWDPRFDVAARQRDQALQRTSPWQTSEAPKDRTVVIIGKIVTRIGDCTSCMPVTCEAHWSEKSQDWLDSDNMSIRRYLEDELVIHCWIDVPRDEEKSVPEAIVTTTTATDADTELGMAWWNGMTQEERSQAMAATQAELGRIPSASEAWEHWKNTAAKGAA